MVGELSDMSVNIYTGENVSGPAEEELDDWEYELDREWTGPGLMPPLVSLVLNGAD